MGIRAALASRSRFGVFWAAFSLSILGDAITSTSLIWYVLARTESPVALGWLSFWLTAPVVVGGLMAGWLLDRFDPRRVMALDSILKAGIVAALPGAAALGILQIWHVYLAAGAIGFLAMIPLAGVPSLLASMVERDDLDAANALETIGFTFGGVAGPPIAGVLFGLFGALGALYIDAATYVAFALATRRCRIRRRTGEGPGASGADLLAAARLIFEHPVLGFLIPALGARTMVFAVAVLTMIVGAAGLSVARLRTAR